MHALGYAMKGQKSSNWGARSDCPVLFRVVRYLPGDWRSALLDDDRRAGVAQASREEAAENPQRGFRFTGAMAIVASARGTV